MASVVPTSQRESQELRRIEENIKFDKEANKWRTSYPFNQDPRVLSDNYGQVLKMQESTERRLQKLDKTEEANAVFNKLIENGALVEISAAELSTWTGPIHYLPIQAVIKEESVTTPLRLVTNSSLQDHKTGA